MAYPLHHSNKQARLLPHRSHATGVSQEAGECCRLSREVYGERAQTRSEPKMTPMPKRGALNGIWNQFGLKRLLCIKLRLVCGCFAAFLGWFVFVLGLSWAVLGTFSDNHFVRTPPACFHLFNDWTRVLRRPSRAGRGWFLLFFLHWFWKVW
jgi:hypothetical protein